VLGAKLEATSSGSVRTIAIDNLCTGVGTTVLEPFEMVTEILVPVPPPQTGSAFLKLVRTAADIAKVNVAVTLTIENDSIKEAKIALGSVAPTLVRAIKAEAALIGNKFGKEVIEAAADAAAEEITPITDIRSTAEYRKRTTSVLVGRAIQKAAERAMASI
jgi:carbon-monoxide dehydrogenase medium subunit